MAEITNPEEFPVCPDCGERHPVIEGNPMMDYMYALADAVKEAQKVVDDSEPNQFPALEAAVLKAMIAGMKLLMMGDPLPKEAPATKVEIPEDDGYGLYL